MSHLHQVVGGLPVWGWACLVGMFLIETVLGRSKNPQLRSIGLALAGLFALLVKPTVGRLPGIGPLVIKLMDLISPPDPGPCPICEGTGRDIAVQPKT
jgi:hypothetical protein